MCFSTSIAMCLCVAGVNGILTVLDLAAGSFSIDYWSVVDCYSHTRSTIKNTYNQCLNLVVTCNFCTIFATCFRSDPSLQLLWLEKSIKKYTSINFQVVRFGTNAFTVVAWLNARWLTRSLQVIQTACVWLPVWMGWLGCGISGMVSSFDTGRHIAAISMICPFPHKWNVLLLPVKITFVVCSHSIHPPNQYRVIIFLLCLTFVKCCCYAVRIFVSVSDMHSKVLFTTI